MKNEPRETLKLIKRMVALSSLRRKRYDVSTPLNPTEKEIFDYLNLNESDKTRL